jgi:cytoskeletal protein CcmA (bactofilin family)
LTNYFILQNKGKSMGWFSKKQKHLLKVELKNVVKQSGVSTQQSVSPNQLVVAEAILEQMIQHAVSADSSRNSQMIAENADQTIIGSATDFKGELTTNGTCIIEGRMVGNVSALNIVLEAGSLMTGNITATTDYIKGKLNGNVRADAIELSFDARVSGDLIYETISIEQGSQINGSLKFKEPTQTQKPRMPHTDEAYGMPDILTKSA